MSWIAVSNDKTHYVGPFNTEEDTKTWIKLMSEVFYPLHLASPTVLVLKEIDKGRTKIEQLSMLHSHLLRP
jgi:hypothetical protein